MAFREATITVGPDQGCRSAGADAPRPDADAPRPDAPACGPSRDGKTSDTDRSATELARTVSQRGRRASIARAADRVKPGGSLVHVVCSVLREEAEDVVEALLAERPEFTAAPFEAREVIAAFGEVARFRPTPHIMGARGTFVARVVRASGR